MLGPMEMMDQSQASGRSEPSWWNALPPGELQAVREALAVLPTDAASAGDDLALAVAAWAVADPVRAAALLDEWLATADEAGDLKPPTPVAGQLALFIMRRLDHAEGFVQRILPALSRCIQRELERHDLKRNGLPFWRSAEEAWFPAQQAPGRFTVDLAVLLSNEAGAFCELAKDREPEYARALDHIEGEQRDLDAWLVDAFWNEEESAFCRHDDEGGTRVDESPCGLVPLVWASAEPALTECLRPQAGTLTPADWPARTWVLFYALLLSTSHNSVVARMRRLGLSAEATRVQRAAWTVLCAGTDATRKEIMGDIPAPVRWLDAHGRTVAMASGAGAVILLLILLGWAFVNRDDHPADDLAGLERRARLAAEDGRHDDAAMLYELAARRGHETYFRYRQAVEWLHLGYHGEAEQTFRDLVAHEPDSPNLRLNLALAVYQQGRREEAADLYRDFLAQVNPALHPELAGRARLAMELIEGQLALDRQAP